MSIWDDIGGVVDDAVEVVEDVGEGLADAAASLFEGAAPLAGILAMGPALFIAGPTYVVPAFLGGAGTAAALIRHRRMEQIELDLALRVYGDTLPLDRIVLTNLSGLGGAAFTMPTIGGDILVNLGTEAYDNPATHVEPPYPVPGKLFVHELCHVWQIAHDKYQPRLCHRLTAGVVEGSAYYFPPADMRQPWPALNLEQEATVVDEWFAPGGRGPAWGQHEDPGHPWWPYVRDVVRRADHPESVNGIPVFGAIVVKWRRLGGQGGFLGAPLAAEAPTGDGTGRLQRFAGGFIAWHPDTGAFSVHGAIAQRWLVLGAERYGYPVTDELATPDGLGRFNHFRALHFDGTPEASIYWTAATGAVEVYGAIRAHWARLSWERSTLGYPVEPEMADGTGRAQRFERGVIACAEDGRTSVREPQPFIGTFPVGPVPTPLTLYTVAADGELVWLAHRAARVGDAAAWMGPRTCGSGWAQFRQVVPAGGSALFAVAQDGVLKWYRHDGFNDGSFVWQGPQDVGSGWERFSHAFAGGDGVLYGIEPDGTLRWYRHGTFLEGGAGAWSGGHAVGSGWTQFARVFCAGQGVIYGVLPDGTLRWYRHLGFADGALGWQGHTDVGRGWADFAQICSPGEGVVLALTQDGRLLRYEHRGWLEGGLVETWLGPQEVASGIRNANVMFALMPASASAVPPVR